MTWDELRDLLDGGAIAYDNEVDILMRRMNTTLHRAPIGRSALDAALAEAHQRGYQNARDEFALARSQWEADRDHALAAERERALEDAAGAVNVLSKFTEHKYHPCFLVMKEVVKECVEAILALKGDDEGSDDE